MWPWIVFCALINSREREKKCICSANQFFFIQFTWTPFFLSINNFVFQFNWIEFELWQFVELTSIDSMHQNVASMKLMNMFRINSPNENAAVLRSVCRQLFYLSYIEMNLFHSVCVFIFPARSETQLCQINRSINKFVDWYSIDAIYCIRITLINSLHSFFSFINFCFATACTHANVLISQTQ